MDVSAGQSTPTSAPPVHPTLREAVRSPRRRRPTGAPPPLPYRLQTSGVGWLVAAVVLVGLALAVFARGMRGSAVAVTVVDDAVVRWLAGLEAPGLEALLRGLARVGSWWVLFTLYFGLLLALLVLRRWRHLLVWLLAWQLVIIVIVGLATVARRPRPFGVDIRSSWGGWALPSLPVIFMTATLMAVLYTLVPEGRWRNTGKWVATTLIDLVRPVPGWLCDLPAALHRRHRRAVRRRTARAPRVRDPRNAPPGAQSALRRATGAGPRGRMMSQPGVERSLGPVRQGLM